MQKQINRKNGAFFLGSILLILSVAGFFTDPVRNRPPVSPLDDPEAAGAVEVIPTIVTPTTPHKTQLPIPSPFYPQTQAHPIQSGLLPGMTEPAPPDGNAYQVPVNPKTPAASPGPVDQVLIPDRIVIPAIDLDAPVLPAHYWLVKENDQTFQEWLPPKQFAAGWQSNSATLGQVGNIVLSGHHNVYGEVFRHLVDLKEGDIIFVYSGGARVTYTITNKMILKEAGEPLSVRFENARWLLPSQDERLTLITCWPYVSNTHRLIIVARPIARSIPNQSPPDEKP